MYLCYNYFNSFRNVEIYFYEKYKDFASFATRRFYTLTKISEHLKGIVSDKNTQYIVSYVYFNLFVHITRDFSFPLAIEMYGRPFLFRAIPTIESTTVLSDINNTKGHSRSQWPQNNVHNFNLEWLTIFSLVPFSYNNPSRSFMCISNFNSLFHYWVTM